MRQFTVSEMPLSGVRLITSFSADDNRGWTVKDYSKEFFEQSGISFEVAETLYIYSHKNVLRGLHFQRVKKQSKLVRCISGAVWIVVVDIKLDSPTLGQWISLKLSSSNGQEIFVPGDCALGTLALENSVITCKCGENFYGQYADGICWNDRDLAIEWPGCLQDSELIISKKDRELQSFHTYISQSETRQK